MELISVIIPIYNVERFLHRCVDSVRKQSYPNLEIILVDDGSPDRCPQICEEYKALDERIKVIHKENGGLGFARNSGLDVATGKYVTFLDSDDWISLDHIENLYRAAKNTNADMILGGYTAVAADGKVLGKHGHPGEKILEGEQVIEELMFPLIGPLPEYPKDVQLESSSCMNLYRTAVIREFSLRFPSEKYAVAEDLFFNLDFLGHTKRAVFVSETGYYYCENPDSISRKYDPKRFERTVRFYEMLKSRVNDYGLEDRADFRVERTFLMKLRVAIRHVVLSKLPGKEKIREIRTMLHHPLVCQVLQVYPISFFSPVMGLLMQWMKREWVIGVYCLMKLREWGREFKKFLK